MQKMPGPAHHPNEDLLFGYAAGAVTGARALIVATHLAYCAHCRSQVAAAETIGGEILDRELGMATGSVPEPRRDAASGSTETPLSPGEFDFAPRHLRNVLAAAQRRWINVWFGVKEMPIPEYGPATRLLWIPKGRRMPRHDHYGEEMTLVLKGNFSDATGHYAAGDFQTGTPGLDHQPHAGSQGPCICLVVEKGGLKLSGWLGRLVAWRGGRPSGNIAA